MVQQHETVSDYQPTAVLAAPIVPKGSESWTAESTIEWAFTRFGRRLALVTGFQAEGMAILDMTHRIEPHIRVLTVDTGRLPSETHELMDRVREYYGIAVEVLCPDQNELSRMVNRHGSNPFYRSVSLRLLCCRVRKVSPLRRALRSLDAWMTGLSRSQSESRSETPKIEVDTANHGIVKVNPLADWSQQQIWDYIRANRVPYNALYDKGYTSIGCAPCTRPLEPGEDRRAGRWWWEKGMPKECGIHLGPASGRHANGSQRFTTTLDDNAWPDLGGSCPSD